MTGWRVPRMSISSSVPGAAIRLDHRERQRFLEAEAVVAAGRATDQLFAREIGLLPSASASVTPWTSRVTNWLAKPALAPAEQRVAADEIALVGVHEAIEAGFVGRVLDRELGADQAVGFLDAQRSIARMPKGSRPRSAPASISVSKMWFWYSSPWCSSQPSSPTKLTRSAVGARPTAISWPVSHGKAALEKSASLTRSSSFLVGPGDDQHAERARQVLELDRAVLRHVLQQLVVVEPLPGAGRDQVEALLALAHDREFGVHAASRVERVAEVDPADFLGSLLATSRSRKASAPGPETRALANAVMSSRPTFLATLRHSLPTCSNHFERRNDQWSSCARPWREPVRPLPAELLAEHRAQSLHAVVAGRHAQRAPGRALLVGVVDREDVGVGLLVLARRYALVA